MPCFIRALRTLGISIPTGSDFTSWLERELMAHLKVNTHEKLARLLDEMLKRNPERLRFILEDLIQKYQKLKEEERLLEKIQAPPSKRRKPKQKEEEAYIV